MTPENRNPIETLVTQLDAIDVAHALRLLSPMPITDLASACAAQRGESYFRSVLEVYGFTAEQIEYVVVAWYPKLSFRLATQRTIHGVL